MSSLIDAILLDALSRAGRPGREVAVRLDLLRSIGLREARQRHSDDEAIAGMRHDGARAGYRSMWLDAARELGAQLTDLSRGFFDIQCGAARTRVWNHWVPLDDAVRLRFALDKPLCHKTLRDAGVPVPEHVEFTADDLSRGEEFLSAGTVPCVVKPAGAFGGSGITTGVRDVRQLQRAVLRARRTSERLLLERQAAGWVHRMLYLDGRLLDVVRRHPPSVTGDGSSTVAELVAGENRRRMNAARDGPPWLLRIDLDSIFTLQAHGLTPRSVPARGATVTVKTSVSQNRADENEHVARARVSDDLVAEGRRAVDALGLRLAAVEIVTPDAERALAQAGGVVIEVNGTPGLHYHYEIREPSKGVRVAVPILRTLLGLDDRSARTAGTAAGS